MNETNVFSESENQELKQHTSKKPFKDCPPGFYVNGKCSEPTVSIDGYLWILVVAGVVLIRKSFPFSH